MPTTSSSNSFMSSKFKKSFATKVGMFLHTPPLGSDIKPTGAPPKAIEPSRFAREIILGANSSVKLLFSSERGEILSFSGKISSLDWNMSKNRRSRIRSLCLLSSASHQPATISAVEKSIPIIFFSRPLSKKTTSFNIAEVFITDAGFNRDLSARSRVMLQRYAFSMPLLPLSQNYFTGLDFRNTIASRYVLLQ